MSVANMSLGVIPRPSSLATSYAQNHLSHPGLEWAEPLNTFLPERDANELMEEINAEWAATKGDKLALMEQLRLFQAKLTETTGSRQPSRPIDLQKCTMKDVLKAIDGATARSNSRKGASTSNFIYSIGKHSPILKQWLLLLPNGDYGSGICGAFTILLDATERLHSMDNLVYECLSNIPVALQRASRFIDVYREQQPLDLIKGAVDLYRSVLLALTNCIKYGIGNLSKRGQVKHFFGSVLKGDNYRQSLKASINSVTENVVTVNEHARMCLHRRTGGIYEMLKERELREQNDTMTSSMAEDVRQSIAVHNSLKALLDSHAWLDGKGLLRDAVEESPPGILRKQGKEKRGKKKISHRDMKPMDPPPELAPPEQDGISAEDLLNLIAYNTFTSVQDLEDALSTMFSSKGSNLVNYASKSDELLNFLHTPSNSSALSIHANFFDTDTLSPLSFLGAQLAKHLLISEKPIVLVYFCSLHTEASNPRANASGLVASLAGQLLDYPSLSFDLSFVDDEMAELLEHDDLTQLVQLFLSLLHQLPSDASVFCFIDEVSVYETPERYGGMRKVLATLIRQVIDRQGDGELVALKLLLTDGNSSMAGDIIGAENVLDMQEDLDGDDTDAADVFWRKFK